MTTLYATGKNRVWKFDLDTREVNLVNSDARGAGKVLHQIASEVCNGSDYTLVNVAESSAVVRLNFKTTKRVIPNLILVRVVNPGLFLTYALETHDSKFRRDGREEEFKEAMDYAIFRAREIGAPVILWYSVDADQLIVYDAETGKLWQHQQ